MNKKPLAVLCLTLTVLLTIAKEAGAQELTSKFTVVDVELDGVYNTLKKGDLFSVTAPAGYTTSTIWMTPKMTGKNTEPQEYMIKVSPQGMSHFAAGDVMPYDSGYVRNYSYRFPVTVQIMNKSGVVLKTFTVVQDNVEFSQLADSNFLAGTGCMSWYYQPFRDEASCAHWTAIHEDGIRKRLSEMAWCNASERIRWVIDAAYGSTRFAKNGYNIYLIKSPTEDQKDLQELCKRMQKTMVNWNPLNIQLSGERQVKLGKMADEFGVALQKPNLSDSLRFLCMHNASVCAMLSGGLEKAVDYYNEYIKIKKDAGVPVRVAYNPDGEAWMRYYYRKPMLHADKDSIDIPYLAF
jgi:hypothetical protein